KGSLAISRRGFTVTADRKLTAAETIPRFTGPRPGGGRPEPKDGGTAEYWTEAIKDDSGDQFAQFKLHARNFLDCVKSRKQPISALESGHRVATVCHLANLSLRLGRKIRWDADKEEIVGDPEAAKMLVRPYRAPWDAVLKSLEVG